MFEGRWNKSLQEPLKYRTLIGCEGLGGCYNDPVIDCYVRLYVFRFFVVGFVFVCSCVCSCVMDVCASVVVL